MEIWKRFRKWGGIPTAITQNVKDLLSSREVENIFEKRKAELENLEFIKMFRDSNTTNENFQVFLEAHRENGVLLFAKNEEVIQGEPNET